MKQCSATTSRSDSLPTTIWLCGQKTSQVQRKGRYTAESNVHPAKMMPEVARKIILAYSQEGELICDPMAGIGTTLIEAMHLGRDAVGIELEEKFVNLAKANIELAQTHGAKGKASMLQGDARNLESLIDSVDLLALSPPYGELDPSKSHMVSKDRALSSNPGYRPSWKAKISDGYLKSSRPYESEAEKALDLLNVAAREYGTIDAIITSPVYGDLLNRSKHVGGIMERDKGLASYKHGYSSDSKNLANSRYGKPIPKSPRDEDLETPTYLSEMLSIYSQCFTILKPGGFLVIVTKNFRKNGTLINLCGDTISLCLKAGFQFYQHVIAVLGRVSDERIVPRASFWQMLHTRKAQEKGEPLCLIQHEDILVFKKSVNFRSKQHE